MRHARRLTGAGVGAACSVARGAGTASTRGGALTAVGPSLSLSLPSSLVPSSFSGDAGWGSGGGARHGLGAVLGRASEVLGASRAPWGGLATALVFFHFFCFSKRASSSGWRLADLNPLMPKTSGDVSFGIDGDVPLCNSETVCLSLYLQSDR